jgi:hypothetical protein
VYRVDQQQKQEKIVNALWRTENQMMKRQQLQLLSKNKKTDQKKGREKILCTGDANARGKQMP